MPKGKGSAPAGNTTTTTINPTAQAQLPYLQDIWSRAQNLQNTDIQQYYPGQTLATAGDLEKQQAYYGLAQGGQNFQNAFLPGANEAFRRGVAGDYGVYNSPAFGGYQNFAYGDAASQQALKGIGNNLAAQGPQYANQIGAYAPTAADYGAMGANTESFGLNALRGGVGMEQLAASARGDYLNKNPYLDRAIQAAQDPVVRNYQTSVTPQLSGLFSGGGRYGSGAMAGAADTAQRNLVQGLGDISTNLSNADYGRERSLQDQAAQAYNQGAANYGSLRNQGVGLGITGATAAGNIANAAGNQNLGYQQQALSAAQQQMLGQQYGLTGLQTGYQSGNAAALQALGQAPQVAGLQSAGPNAQIAGSTGLQAIEQATLDDMAKRFYGVQSQPYANLGLYSQAVGGGLSGSGSTTQPYFQNQFANTLSGLTGAAGLAQKLGAFGGASGLAGATFPATGSAFGSLFPGAAASSLGAYAAAPGGAEIISGLGGLGAAGGTAAETGLLGGLGAATVICTELRRQNRMPRRHYFASARHDAKIPAVIRRGYHFWAIPSVRHLRRHPDSLYSRLLCTVFNWRAEDLAARAGIKGARKLWRGRALTCVLCVPCLVLGFLVPEPDWRSVYSLKTTT